MYISAMSLEYLIYWSLSLSAYANPVSPKNISHDFRWQSLNSSSRSAGPTNCPERNMPQLGAWPTFLPWYMYVTFDLSFEVTWYGAYAPPIQWDRIRDSPVMLNTASNLTKIGQRLPGHLGNLSIMYLVLSRWISYSDKSREFKATVKLSKKPAMEYGIWNHLGK